MGNWQTMHQDQTPHNMVPHQDLHCLVTERSVEFRKKNLYPLISEWSRPTVRMTSSLCLKGLRNPEVSHCACGSQW